MTYRLHTLNSEDPGAAAPTRSGRGRFAGEVLLFVSLVLLAYWLLALTSHNLLDAAGSTSGDGGPVRNRGGQLGPGWPMRVTTFLASRSGGVLRRPCALALGVGALAARP